MYICQPLLISLFPRPDVPVEADTQTPRLPSENIPLHLPSSLPAALQSDCNELMSMECRLRYGQCDDSLGEIRRLRRVLKNVTYFKNKNITGTGGETQHTSVHII